MRQNNTRFQEFKTKYETYHHNLEQFEPKQCIMCQGRKIPKFVTAQPNLNLTWNASNHQYFVTAHPTPTQYFGLIVTAQPNLSLPWDASNLHQHFVTAHLTPTQYKPV